MIVFDNISKIYTPTQFALKNVNLRILPKEFVSVVGASGAGKSTLLKLLIAEEKPTEGKIFLDGLEVTSLGYGELPKVRRRIGTVFQDYKLLPNKTAFENVAFAMEAAGAKDSDIREDVPEALGLVGLLDKADNFPHELSGGEKQRVAIARALVNRPEVIMADEPTGSLDPITSIDIIKLLLKINELGTTIILATHNKEVVDELGRRVITMEKGEVVRDEEKGKYVI
ncbi:MAG: cell division ATP-binding protein FtsE [Candidatus Sungbacteria bacterium RIFCSPLOWO2_01_FULL_47_32]|uniref:Cell division ATP-binding protein FtsE n=1 Tax=Candidatus Sungbacteria bacterium RIFCSPHIGHO2_01_FULL_47_32 TaxID=1802264 RepID=A0A1G2K511_9BACT|nr:MAG: Cell division ATP-binding protein FtsE [Parcubacteria group bacterium GW2011_GWA2_47_10]OGZ93538.1 MAG: cell division ATP-binding protein FtsE [Candidatus Sungbacteria bacterium RIFCSPHIGHO2_01_FULL_47_32]OGZ99412.1 MAG: cell division ATP-binding protein FtsE [Candidatus Sungbacteria bacterium RIFCSPHIGHO2_02_FULL_46_12]OHA05636.1 MAG: cell division ATP-binding protein FtsE [Candidatus Sungbacteria bacterium RIFCSPLOWO2_01_FULL_47_32]